ncbi:hypothetical protein [Tumebacillus flagellatus]|uniref:Uncharacterized protein n=1 Tax=Tumebacillus flagellatus TaxID=1157490 RepID=A0A074LXT2_9BACL|nr:hypothetical protein [Tumebacillus flagellatus]KEO85240.1 hypothetical protein EL26_01395 [Tumebacillus flagellatus]
MALILMEAVAILLFWLLIEKDRVREWLPLVLTGMFLRFLYQFFLMDWCKVWVVSGPQWAKLWAPISADVTIWPVVVLIFIQYMPASKWRFGYASLFVAGTVLYIKALSWLHIVDTRPPWNIGFGVFVQGLFYSILYGLWHWLSPQMQRGGSRT